MVFPYYPYPRESVANEPGYYKGYSCAFCPGSGTPFDFKPPENWNVISCIAAGTGTHGCCSSCVVVLIELQYIGPDIELPIEEPPTIEPISSNNIWWYLLILILLLLMMRD